MAENQFSIPNAVVTTAQSESYLAYKYSAGTGDAVEPTSDPSDQPCGFSTQPTKHDGQLINLHTHGNTQARCDGGWTRGAELTCSDTADKEGYLKVATTGDIIVAYALDACTDGAVGNVQIAPRGQVAA